MQFLTRRLEKAVIVEPRVDGSQKVFFGAIVEVEDEDCVKATYQIVGEDEIDLTVGRISWRSPLGRALLGKKEDDTIVFRKPSGEVELTLLSVRYESDGPPTTE
jgi:transcription elongation factor GreB